MPLCFAYGSNMDRAAMGLRCPASRALGLARLQRHRLIINRDGYATVVRDARGVVWGLLWDLALKDVPALDRYESVASRLYAKATRPVLAATGAKQALIYLARSSEPGRARPGYAEGIVAAARAIGCPDAYVRTLEAWTLGDREAAEAARPRVRPRWSSPLA